MQKHHEVYGVFYIYYRATIANMASRFDKSGGLPNPEHIRFGKFVSPSYH